MATPLPLDSGPGPLPRPGVRRPSLSSGEGSVTDPPGDRCLFSGTSLAAHRSARADAQAFRVEALHRVLRPQLVVFEDELRTGYEGRELLAAAKSVFAAAFCFWDLAEQALRDQRAQRLAPA